MDPNSTLVEIRELADRLYNGAPPDQRYTTDNMICEATRLGELVLALDEWLESGGFLPVAWHKAQHTPSVAAPATDCGTVLEQEGR